MDQAVRDFLTFLEQQEAPLLSWGIVEGGISEDELYDFANQFLSEEGYLHDADELVEEMLGRRLVFRLPSVTGPVYRTRMAETVRLFARLRQLFPNRDWRGAERLVSDYRFDLRPRTYPARHLSPDQVVDSLDEDVGLTSLQQRALLAMLNATSQEALHLADFQLHAARRILSDLEVSHSRGVIIGAGTGTGKTLAFYLPALVQIARHIHSNAYWTKVLALYPRNELLKDQINGAYQQARHLDDLLTQEGRRKVVVGAYYGDTPRYPEQLRRYDIWPRSEDGRGYVCPYLRCSACGSEMVWTTVDLDNQAERLHCGRPSCRQTIEPDEVRLTRNRISKEPPDVLFTTTEMMNRLMVDAENGHVIGVGSSVSPPDLVLIDEVHTYAGVHGAQVAHLLRRWRHAIGRRGRPQFTGLSATLRNAATFFARLTGINTASIAEVSPSGDSGVQQSVAYQLALRGDPVSRASLLSTTIQAVMLLRRVLDPTHAEPSQGLYGKRVFAFTDNLDVINRLYHNLRDAEGLDAWGHQRTPSLAGLRARDGSEEGERLSEGQLWRLAEEIGHPDLGDALSIERTSSQDRGVDQNPDVVVATASLEVGYDDPEVGAVLQHKAPMSMASFLQRRGRAGRPPTMRPWTVVVLSDYGRDRAAYQSYDLLFDPGLEERSLPVSNRYVLRIQAVFSFMDWMAQQMHRGNVSPGNLWSDFAGPPRYQRRHGRQRQRWVASMIRGLLEGSRRLDPLKSHLQRALRLDEGEVLALLWEPPCALMIAVLPTLLRRLESGWAKYVAGGPNGEEPHTRNPLPEFVPHALFGDLNLPEVTIQTPRAQEDEGESFPVMAVAKALREFAPGRVSRRFGIHQSQGSHWVALPAPHAASNEQVLPIERFCERFEEIGLFQVYDERGHISNVPCLRPWVLQTERVPNQVRDSSNAQLNWRTQIIPADDGDAHEVSDRLAWHRLVPQIRFYTHNRHSHVEVRRFALGAEATVRFTMRQEDVETSVRFARGGEHGEPVSLGLSQWVDGMAFHLTIPEDLRVDPEEVHGEKIRSLRTAYLNHRIQEDSSLDGTANVFQRDWLSKLFLAALIEEASTKGTSLEEAHARMQDRGDMGDAMAAALDRIFEAEIEEAEEGQERAGELIALCRNDRVQQALSAQASALWGPPDDEWYQWAERRYKSTLGSAIVEACQQLCPEFESSSLHLDIDPGPLSPEASDGERDEAIWITEDTIGGGGIVEEIERRLRGDPRRFFQLVESALAASDFELVDAELTRILESVQTDAAIQQTFAAVRSAYGLGTLREENARLRRLLAERGVLGIHAVQAALQARILKPGSSAQTDELLHRLITHWREEEERLGVEISVRVFSHLASRGDQYADMLRGVRRGHTGGETWRFQTIYGLLWPRGNAIRARGLSMYNPFTALPPSDRLIVLAVLPDRASVIDVANADWRGQARDALREHGLVKLRASATDRQALKSAMLDLTSTSLDIGFLRLHPRMDGIEREAEAVTVTFVLPEAVQ